ncbi:uncharacterized protein LOC110036102 isoform X2 [Phalaenopsis equestris]|uniref:uncharacterized protein LOC110036102 isoform X2 n=1 Tax=Phalaenopsis equestris TaxID=78828 RepID=UPI0009E1FA45|nr:uncharacterized protein LOC110036102 isoform X2 [Phalaenopsis equestris]
MLARGWSATAGCATLTTATFAAKFSSQSQTLNFSWGMTTRLDKPRKVDQCYMPCSRVLDPEGNGNGRITSSDLVEREYADLNLKNLYDDGQIPVDAPDWDDVFNDSKLPLMVDIGSGSGRFLIWLAKRFPDSRNCLGLEIRHKLVQRCQFWAKELSLRNIHFLSCNATISFERLVSSYPGPLAFVTILCPDPHFKKRHHKRRVLQKPLVDSILNNLITGGQVLMQSDVLQVAVDMRDQLDQQADVLKHIDAIDGSFSCDEEGWLRHNPFGIRTEREIHAELEGAKIYRRMYQKL